MSMPQEVIASVAAKTEIEFPAEEAGIGEVEEALDGGGEDAGDAVDGINGGDDGEGTDLDGDAGDADTEEDAADAEGSEVDAQAAEGETQQGEEEDVDVERLAQLATSESEVRQERAQLKQQMAEVQQLRQQVEQQSQQVTQFVTNLRKSPFETLDKLGVPIEGLMEQIIDNGGEIPAGEQAHPEEDVPQWAQGMMTELKSLREEKAQAQQADQNATNEGQYRDVIKTGLSDEKYGLLGKVFPGGATAVEDAVFDLAARHFEAHKEVLPPQKILDTLDVEWREHLQSLSTHAEALEAMGLKGSTPTKPTKRKNPPGSEPVIPGQNSLSGDMHANGAPKKRGKTRDEDIHIAANNLNGQSLWPDMADDDDDD